VPSRGIADGKDICQKPNREDEKIPESSFLLGRGGAFSFSGIVKAVSTQEMRALSYVWVINHQMRRKKTMKKTFWKLTWILIMTVAVGLSVIQLNSSVVKADGCQDYCPTMYAGCYFSACTSVTVNGTTWVHCYYECMGGGDIEEAHEIDACCDS
jgi:hypothetical protein